MMRAFAFIVALLMAGPLAAAAPDWQEAGRKPVEVRIGTGDGKPFHAAAAMGTSAVYEGKQWPRLLRSPIAWQSILRPKPDFERAVDLGTISLGAESADAPPTVVESDWSHVRLRWMSQAQQLDLWLARTSPAVVLHTASPRLHLFGGNDTPRPRFCAFPVGDRVVTHAFGSGREEVAELPDPKGPTWMLVWYGDAFSSSRFPSHVYKAVTEAYPYPADCPVLLFFEHAPTGVRVDESGLTATFPPATGAGHAAVLPIFGDAYPLAVANPSRKAHTADTPYGPPRRLPAEFRHYSLPTALETHTWTTKLPDEIAQTCRWWAQRLHRVPISVREEYSRDDGADTVTVTERFNYLSLSKSEPSTVLAPLPPMLALAREQGLPITFNGEVVTSSVVGAHGPFAAIEGADSYTWQIAGLGRYVAPPDQAAPAAHPDSAPLLEELKVEVTNILDAGPELSPWYPVLNDGGAGYRSFYNRGYRGNFVFQNPGETAYFLAEAAPLLDAPTRLRIIEYVRALLARYPLDKRQLLPLGQGAPRERYLRAPESVLDQQNKAFRKFNWYVATNRIPERNLYYLSRYSALTGDTAAATQHWPALRKVLNSYLNDADWATLAFVRRPGPRDERAGYGGVMDSNTFFAGCVGGVRLAKLAGDDAALPEAWGALARAAVSRFAMGKYGRYLHDHELLRSPTEPDWMTAVFAGSWRGWLRTPNWSGPQDDVQQVWQMDQFGTHYREERGQDYAGLTFMLGAVPELAMFIRDHLHSEAQTMARRFEEAVPAWWTMYCPAAQGFETNFQPPEDSHQMFLIKALVLGEDGSSLARRLDVPWLARGDLFYLHKLILTINAHRQAPAP